MGRAVPIERDDMSAQDLRQPAGRVKDGRVSRRLLALAPVLEVAKRKVAAESCAWTVRRCAIGFIVTMLRALQA